MYHFRPTDPVPSYLLGFLAGDGHMRSNTRNRGAVSIELSKRDRSLLERFQEAIPVHSSLKDRARDTNFRQGHESSVLTFYDLGFRTLLHDLGIPYGAKSKIIAPPALPYSKPDYFRGLLDADGSLGVSKGNRPFVSWCTSSPQMAEALLEFIFEVTGQKKTATPNKRDSAYNISVFCENAQLLVNQMYYPRCIALVRKKEKAQGVQSWERPRTMRQITWERRRWTPEEDQFILEHPIEESVESLNRTARSIRQRRWRIQSGK